MVPATTALSFLVVMVLGAMSPGPDFVLVTRTSLVGGRRAGLAAAAGIAVGVFVWVVTVAFGAAALLLASAEAFTVVRLAGAAYLVFLGVRAWRAVRRGDYPALDRPTDADRVPAGATFRQGLLMNLLNPKVAVYLLALLPQFLRPHTGPAQTLQLAVVALVATALWFLPLAAVVGSFRRILGARRVRRATDAVLGTVLIALGLRVAAEAT